MFCTAEQTQACESDDVASSGPLTPGLPPHKLQAAGGGKVFFDGVVDPLDEHAGQVGPLQQIGHSSTVTKRVYCPPTARSYTYDSERETGISGLSSDKRKECIFQKQNHSTQQGALKVAQSILSPTE